LHGVKVLIVDDYELSRLSMARLLAQWECRFLEAATGERALHLLREAVRSGDPFNAAIIDMQMPGMDGAQLASEIRRSPELRATALVCLRALGLERMHGGESELFAVSVGKPVRAAQLLEGLMLSLASREGSAAPPAPPAAPRFPAGTASALRVLLAEDNPVNQLVAQRLLARLGVHVEVVVNGEEAIDILRKVRFDLVLMDCQMPVMDGFEATRRIRDRASGVLNPLVPIVAMTANAMRGDRERCLEAGMTDYLSKPVNPEALTAVIDRLGDSRGESHTAAVPDVRR
jgi:CheY-like chemotaxis protein